MSFEITFKICDKYTSEFTTNNLMKNPIKIKRITTMNNNSNKYGLVLNNINNTRISHGDIKQSPLVWLNPGYNSEILSIVVPKSEKWEFILIDKDEKNVSTDYDIDVNLICEIIK